MKRSTIIRLAAIVSGLSGLTILIASVWPIIEYQLTDSRAYTTLLSPLAVEKMNQIKKQILQRRPVGFLMQLKIRHLQIRKFPTIQLQFRN